ncbi:hypothetical protein COOONC_17906 [Cooperia oncophora]
MLTSSHDSYGKKSQKKCTIQKMQVDRIRNSKRVFCSIITCLDEAERDEMLYYFYREGYVSRRSTIARATAKLHDTRVNMEVVPREYAFLRDGTAFLQYKTADLHIYFSRSIIEKAAGAGLHALVGDGVHDLQPDATNKTGQLYTIHGVLVNSVDVPLLFAITRRKNQRVYETIYGNLKDAIVAAGGPQDIRILLDFEQAAIKAAKRRFPSASVEGCAFHLAQAWNRKRDALGLRPQVRGPSSCARVRSWWATIKGLIFLPKHLHTRVPALFRPPASLEPGVYEKCAEFLVYLRNNWYEGPFRDLWQKWDITHLRTTNAAEAFHRLAHSSHLRDMTMSFLSCFRQIGVLLDVKHPRMSDLIRTLQGFVTTARMALIRTEKRRAEEKKLHKKDILRRRRIAAEMSRFKALLRENRAFIRTATITSYCRRMSRFITDKRKKITHCLHQKKKIK